MLNILYLKFFKDATFCCKRQQLWLSLSAPFPLHVWLWLFCCMKKQSSPSRVFVVMGTLESQRDFCKYSTPL